MRESISRTLVRAFGLSLVLGLLLVASSVHAAGLMTPVGGDSAPLSIRSHHVDVTIEGGYAITEIEQVFHNPHSTDLEAYYSFPVPEQGTVAEFTLWIDGQPVTGEVLEKQRAREVYQQEKAAGRDAGLTEKDAYRSFDVYVSPLRARQDTRVRLVYIQPAFVDSGVGRYVYPLEEGGVDEHKLAFWSANEVVEEAFSFTLTLRSGYPVDALRLPQHAEAALQQLSDNEWQVTMNNYPGMVAPAASDSAPAESANAASGASAATATAAAAFRLDRDIVVYWRHRQGLPGGVELAAYKPEGKERGTFMMTLTPGGDLPPITTGSDWVFVLDVSGSMSAKLATLADGVVQALQRMRPQDRFRIVLFNNSAWELTRGYVPASEDKVREYARKVAGLASSGGTNLYGGLSLAMDSLDADRPTGIVLVTDGVANVGVTAQKDFLKLLERYDVRLFTAIMGNSANRPLLGVLTDASNGFAVSVSNSDDVVGHILQASAKLTRHAMNEVEIDIDGVKVADLRPQRIGSVYHGEQIVLLGHYWGGGMADVSLKAKVGGRPVSYQTRFAFPAEGGQNPELERLWAYAAIRELQREAANFGDDSDIRQAVVDLGVEYGLVTDHTSMVVLREEVFEQYGIERRNANRRELERLAKAQRAQQAPPATRVDSQQPMFGNAPQAAPGGSGSGALGPWWLLLLLPVLAALPRLRRLV